MSALGPVVKLKLELKGVDVVFFHLHTSLSLFNIFLLQSGVCGRGGGRASVGLP
jgi:hypothetical protein